MANLLRKAPLLAILCASVALAQYPPIDPVLTGGTDDAGVKRPISSSPLPLLFNFLLPAPWLVWDQAAP